MFLKGSVSPFGVIFLTHTHTEVTFSQQQLGNSSFDDQMATKATEKNCEWATPERTHIQLNFNTLTLTSTLQRISKLDLVFLTYSLPQSCISPPGQRWTGTACWPPAWPGLWVAGAAV